MLIKILNVFFKNLLSCNKTLYIYSRFSVLIQSCTIIRSTRSVENLEVGNIQRKPENLDTLRLSYTKSNISGELAANTWKIQVHSIQLSQFEKYTF